MPETNKYILTLAIILAIVMFSYLIYKVIKSVETIKDYKEQICDMTNVISSRDAVIKQMIKDKGSSKNAKAEKSDQETDYFNNKVPIEVFNDKASEFNKKPVIEEFKTCAVKKCVSSEAPVFSPKVNIIKGAIDKLVSDAAKSPATNVAIIDSENSLSTSSMIKNAVTDVDVTMMEGNDYSDAMYIVKEATPVSVVDILKNTNMQYSDSDSDDEVIVHEEGDVEEDFDYGVPEDNELEEELEEEEIEEEDEESEIARIEEARIDALRTSMQKMSVADVKSKATSLQIALSSGKHKLNKKELIEKILEA
jgi:hypothetical protein